jgi:zinc transport system permease protein
MSEFLQMLGFAFVRRALVAGVAIAIGCGLLGVFLVLRRQAMMGDGLAHFAFGAVGLALLLGCAPLALALPLTALASLAIFLLPERAGPYADAAIGMISALGVAAGVLMASLGGGFNVDLFSFLFGDILAVNPGETALAAALAVGVVALVFVARSEWLAITYDETAARVAGIRPTRWRRLLAVLTALVVVLGIRLVGTMLVSSLLIFPAVTALQERRSFRGVLATAPVFGALSVVGGVGLAVAFDLPAGATIVLWNAVFLACSLARRSFRRRPA